MAAFDSMEKDSATCVSLWLALGAWSMKKNIYKFLAIV